VAAASSYLATKAAVQGEALGPGAKALRPCLLLWLRCPDVDGGGHIEILCMLQVYIPNVSDVLEAYYKSRLGCCTCCNGLYTYVSSVCSKCFICFRRMLRVFQFDVAKLDRDATYICNCFSVFIRVPQVFHLDVCICLQ
jgi:hypothetical protein